MRFHFSAAFYVQSDPQFLLRAFEEQNFLLVFVRHFTYYLHIRYYVIHS